MRLWCSKNKDEYKQSDCSTPPQRATIRWQKTLEHHFADSLTGKVHELVGEVKRYSMEVVGILYIKCRDCNTLVLDDGCKLFYPGLELEHSARVGVWIPVSLSLMAMLMNGKCWWMDKWIWRKVMAQTQVLSTRIRGRNRYIKKIQS